MKKVFKKIENLKKCEFVEYCCNIVEIINDLTARRPGFVSRFGENSNQVSCLDGEIAAYRNAIHWFIGIELPLVDVNEFIEDITKLNCYLTEE